MKYELKPTDTPRAIIDSLAIQLEQVASYLAEEHNDDVLADHHGDDPDDCTYCQVIEGAKLENERARAWLDADPQAPITGRKLEVVLASLRYMQADLEHFVGSVRDGVPRDVIDILESGPTTPEEIDALCLELNTGEKEEEESLCECGRPVHLCTTAYGGSEHADL